MMRIRKAKGWDAIPMMKDALRFRCHLKDSSGLNLFETATQSALHNRKGGKPSFPCSCGVNHYRYWIFRDMRHLKMAAMLQPENIATGVSTTGC